MTDNAYENPRIDGQDAGADAVCGTVRADAVKIAWVGPMFLFGTVGSALTYSAGALALFVLSSGITLCLGHSLGMHRRFIHRAYRCPLWLEYLFVHFGVLVGLAGPLGMLRTHDLRDWAQRQPDCHSYFSHDEAWYRDFWWQLFCSIRLDSPPEIKIEPAIANDRVYRFMEKTWMLQQLPWAVLFFAIGGWGWVFWGICSRVSVSVCGHWLIGHFAHNTGGRDWHVDGAAVQGFNVPFAALLTMGESWHNNHHAFPGSAKLGLAQGQWDPGWWVLQGLARLGLASDFVTPESLSSRPELVALVDGDRKQEHAECDTGHFRAEAECASRYGEPVTDQVGSIFGAALHTRASSTRLGINAAPSAGMIIGDSNNENTEPLPSTAVDDSVLRRCAGRRSMG